MFRDLKDWRRGIELLAENARLARELGAHSIPVHFGMSGGSREECKTLLAKVAVAGEENGVAFAHGHIRGLMRSFAELPKVEWVACADTGPAVPSISTKPGTRRVNLRVAREQIGIPKTYADYHVMLEKEEFDIILFCPENARHGEVGEADAARGIHRVTEKPMAATLSEALSRARAARASDVELMVDWPATCRPAALKAKALLDAGAIGDLLEVKWRNGGSFGPPPRGEHLSGEKKGAG